MAQTGIHYEQNKWLRGDNYVNIQCRIMVLVHCLSPDCHLSINKVPFQSPKYFPRYGPDKHPLWKNKWLWGDNTVNIQGRIMVLVHCPSSHWHLSIKQVSFQSLKYFQDMARTGNNYEKLLRGDNTVNIQGRIMIILFCPFPHYHLSIYQVWFKCQQ